MTDKGPWSHGSLEVVPVYGIDVWRVFHETRLVAELYSEADARLFAAANGLYEALESARNWMLAIRCENDSFFEADRDELVDVITAALRAANPEAFDGEGE